MLYSRPANQELVGFLFLGISVVSPSAAMDFFCFTLTFLTDYERALFAGARDNAETQQRHGLADISYSKFGISPHI